MEILKFWSFIEESALPKSKLKQIVGTTVCRWDKAYILYSTGEAPGRKWKILPTGGRGSFPDGLHGPCSRCRYPWSGQPALGVGASASNYFSLKLFSKNDH